MAGVTPPREKICIIGGGIGALTSAYFLTDPQLAGRFEVTVYTMGWRLGGKGASGRNQHRQSRIEEHGLHIWFGTYHNAISLMRRCYAELGRTPDQPLATFEDAFKAQRRVVLLEAVGDQRRPWPIDFPDLPPLGDGLTVLGLLRRLIDWLTRRLDDVPGLDRRRVADFTDLASANDIVGAMTANAAGLTARQLAQLLAEQVRSLDASSFGATFRLNVISGGLRLLARMAFDLLSPGLPENDEARRLWTIIYLGITAARGMIDDRLFERGFDVVETVELRSWLASHSSFIGSADQQAADDPVFFSSCLQAFYDASFSYADGDAEKPNVAASAGLRCILRILFDYSGPIILEMQAGMGDAVFAPLYQVLRRRGVRFAFFHRLTDLHLDASRQRIERLDLSRQVQLPAAQPYEPLIMVKGLACWPSEPLFDQIIDGAAVKASGDNLEHWQTSWTDTGGSLSLARGTDFDRVVLAISYDVLPEVTRALSADARWKAMIKGLDTTATQAAQLWFAATREQLGLAGPPEIFGGYVQPWSSLTDFSHLLVREDWQAGNAPRYLNYTCGTLANSAAPDNDAVFDRMVTFLQHNAGPLWPNSVGPAGFKFEMLHAPPAVTGKDRLKEQYFRANTDPTERYVIAKAGTASVRLKPSQSGFSNLAIAGEWTDTGVNISSIEAAVISGMRVSREIAGLPQRIPGERDL